MKLVYSAPVYTILPLSDDVRFDPVIIGVPSLLIGSVMDVVGILPVFNTPEIRPSQLTKLSLLFPKVIPEAERSLFAVELLLFP